MQGLGVIVSFSASFALRHMRQQFAFALGAQLAQRKIVYPLDRLLGFLLTIHSRLSANFFRAKNNRDFTVPSGSPVSFATSLVL
jgi:hypothetical protein